MATVRIEPTNGVVLVKAASLSVITKSGPQTVDSVSCVAGDLVLELHGAAGVNAVYIVRAGAWDVADPGQGDGLQVFVKQGATLEGASYRVTTNNPIVWGTDAVTFANSGSSSGATLTSPVLVNPEISSQTSSAADADTVKLYSPNANGAATASLGILAENGSSLIPACLTASGAMLVGYYAQSLVDDASITLPVTTGAMIDIVGGTEGGKAAISSAGAVTIISGSTNFVGTDTDNKLCVFDGGASAVVRNRLGSTVTVVFTLTANLA